MQRDPAVEVDVAGAVDREGHSDHLEIALEQPAVDDPVVLVGVTGHEGVDPEGMPADLEPARRLEFLLARQRDLEDNRRVLDVFQLGGVEGFGDDRVDIGHDSAFRCSSTAWR